MQAVINGVSNCVINGVSIEVSDDMQKCAFFTEWIKFPTANGVIEFDTAYFDEFLLLNIPLDRQPAHFHALSLQQLCKLADAMEHFDYYDAFPNIKRAFRKIFWPMDIIELIEFTNMMEDRYCPMMLSFYLELIEIKLSQMSFTALNEFSNVFATYPINATNGKIRKSLYYCIYYASKPYAIDFIERAIDDFANRSIRRPNWPSVSWGDLFTSKLSKEFVEKRHDDYLDYVNFFTPYTNAHDEEINDFYYCRIKPLYLTNLPIERYMHLLAFSLVPHCNMERSAIENANAHINNKHWNDYGIDYSKFDFIQPIRPQLSISGQVFVQPVQAPIQPIQPVQAPIQPVQAPIQPVQAPIQAPIQPVQAPIQAPIQAPVQPVQPIQAPHREPHQELTGAALYQAVRANLRRTQ